ncbi:MAG TPA: HD domain-containing protein [Anaerolineae bacterium]|nr:HD domain-containing protein [Anaerolineae bacterium]
MFTDRFSQALNLAQQLHATQVRKGTDIPYIGHLLAVTSLVIENGGSEDEAIAALLHDAVEDQGGARTLENIRQQFGDQVAAIVAGCSDTDQIPKPPWRNRKEAYIDHVRHASRSIQLVSLADKVHNARSILADYRIYGDAVWTRFHGGKSGTLWYYRALVDAFRANGHPPLVAELDRVITELEQLTSAAPPNARK